MLCLWTPPTVLASLARWSGLWDLACRLRWVYIRYVCVYLKRGFPTFHSMWVDFGYISQTWGCLLWSPPIALHDFLMQPLPPCRRVENSLHVTQHQTWSPSTSSPWKGLGRSATSKVKRPWSQLAKRGATSSGHVNLAASFWSVPFLGGYL